MSTLHQSSLGGHCLARLAVGVPCTSVDVLIVQAHGDAIAIKELCTLIPRHARHGILRTEQVSLRRTTVSVVAVVDLVPSEVVVDAQCSAGLVVVVLDGQTGCTTRNPLVVLQFGLRHGARVRGVPVRQV